MSKYEITQKQWYSVIGSYPNNIHFKGCDDCPIDSISWEDTQLFIKRLNEITGLYFRLPTEAEWEYACRAGTKTPFYFGHCITTDLVNYYPLYSFLFDNDVCFLHFGEDRNKPIRVGSFPPNSFGLYDMHGNVEEWCQDWFDIDFYKKSPKKNPICSDSSSGKKVLRGGSWDSGPGSCTSSARYCEPPDYKDPVGFIGFRLAMDYIDPEKLNDKNNIEVKKFK